MSKVKIVDLLASICLLIGSIINIVELFIDVHIVISIIATVLIFVSNFSIVDGNLTWIRKGGRMP